jgi:hypothetical protein
MTRTFHYAAGLFKLMCKCDHVSETAFLFVALVCMWHETITSRVTQFTYLLFKYYS